MNRLPTNATSRKKKTPGSSASPAAKKVTRKTKKKKKVASATTRKKTTSRAASTTSKKTARKKVSQTSASSPAPEAVSTSDAPKAPATGGSSATTGALSKMRAEHNSPVEYFLPVGDGEPMPLNPAIGRVITIEYQSRIECVHCGRKINKSFNQGYCFPCLRKLAQCDSCIIKPELCHHHEGTCREPDWAERNCFQPHVVYIANTSGLKVGITRGTQIPTRWIDQGAHKAIPMYVVRDRRMSGLVEVAVKQEVADKTDFRRMLKGDPESRDMQESVDALRAGAQDAIAAIRKEHGEDAVEVATDQNVREFNYPVTAWPEKVKSVTLDKEPVVKETLTGIKGQDLMFGSTVFNVRRHSGYVVSVSVE